MLLAKQFGKIGKDITEQRGLNKDKKNVLKLFAKAQQKKAKQEKDDVDKDKITLDQVENEPKITTLKAWGRKFKIKNLDQYKVANIRELRDVLSQEVRKHIRDKRRVEAIRVRKMDGEKEEEEKIKQYKAIDQYLSTYTTKNPKLTEAGDVVSEFLSMWNPLTKTERLIFIYEYLELNKERTEKKKIGAVQGYNLKHPPRVDVFYKALNPVLYLKRYLTDTKRDRRTAQSEAQDYFEIFQSIVEAKERENIPFTKEDVRKEIDLEVESIPADFLKRFWLLDLAKQKEFAAYMISKGAKMVFEDPLRYFKKGVEGLKFTKILDIGGPEKKRVIGGGEMLSPFALARLSIKDLQTLAKSLGLEDLPDGKPELIEKILASSKTVEERFERCATMYKKHKLIIRPIDMEMDMVESYPVGIYRKSEPFYRPSDLFYRELCRGYTSMSDEDGKTILRIYGEKTYTCEVKRFESQKVVNINPEELSSLVKVVEKDNISVKFHPINILDDELFSVDESYIKQIIVVFDKLAYPIKLSDLFYREIQDLIRHSRYSTLLQFYTSYVIMFAPFIPIQGKLVHYSIIDRIQGISKQIKDRIEFISALKPNEPKKDELFEIFKKEKKDDPDASYYKFYMDNYNAHLTELRDMAVVHGEYITPAAYSLMTLEEKLPEINVDALTASLEEYAREIAPLIIESIYKKDIIFPSLTISDKINDMYERCPMFQDYYVRDIIIKDGECHLLHDLLGQLIEEKKRWNVFAGPVAPKQLEVWQREDPYWADFDRRYGHLITEEFRDRKGGTFYVDKSLFDRAHPGRVAVSEEIFNRNDVSRQFNLYFGLEIIIPDPVAEVNRLMSLDTETKCIGCHEPASQPVYSMVSRSDGTTVKVGFCDYACMTNHNFSRPLHTITEVLTYENTPQEGSRTSVSKVIDEI